MNNNNGPEITLDHIGIAVGAIGDESHKFWEVLGWPAKSPFEIVKDQKVKVEMLELKNNARLELLEATDETSPIKKFIDKRGPGVHHICLRVKNINEMLLRLKKAGVKLINETPVPGAHGCQVAFIHPSSTGGILVELSQKG